MVGGVVDVDVGCDGECEGWDVGYGRGVGAEGWQA
jgi:hypothetical protein